MEMRLRVLDAGVDKYGLNAYIFDCTNDGRDELRPGPLLAHQGRAPTPSATCARASGPTSRSRIDRRHRSTARPPGMLVKVEELSPDLSRVRLFHTSVSRAIASWPTLAGRARASPDFDEFLAQNFPTSTAADFAILEAGVTSEETYVEQGLYWSTGHVPMLEYVAEDLPARTCCWSACRRPTSSSTSSSGLVEPKLPERRAEPGLRRRRPGRRRATAASGQREGFIRSAYQECRRDADARPRAGRRGTRRRSSPPTTASPRSSWPSTPASRWSTSGLLSTPQTSNCRPGHRRDDRQGQGLLGRRRAADLPQPRRARPGRRRASSRSRPADERRRPCAQIKAAFLAPDRPERLDRTTASPRAGRSSTAPSPRPRPATSRTGRARPPTWPTRRGPATWSCSPTRRTSSTPRRPGTLVAPSHFFGQHGYVPDVQDLAANVNMRATFLAGGKGVAQGHGRRARTIDLAPTLAFLLGIPEPQHSQGKVLLRRASRAAAATSRSRSSG